jgi:prephenate dehydrogenase
VFATLTVLAPGLLGGSVAQAARSRGVAQRIQVWSRRAETRARLRGLQWCDAVCETPMESVRGAELVVVCAPVGQIVPLIMQVAPSLASGTLVTDVGSVKSAICRTATAALHGHAHFVGAHPMAGSDRTGHEHATPDLFRGRTCFVTPLPDSNEAAVDRVAAFWRALDADVVRETPERHDEIVAHVSHLPQVMASTLCSFLAQRDPRWRDLAGNGLRDTTRIASSDAELWRGILELNRDEVLRAVRGLQDELQHLSSALANGDFLAVKSMLERGRAYRAGLQK